MSFLEVELSYNLSISGTKKVHADMKEQNKDQNKLKRD